MFDLILAWNLFQTDREVKMFNQCLTQPGPETGQVTWNLESGSILTQKVLDSNNFTDFFLSMLAYTKDPVGSPPPPTPKRRVVSLFNLDALYGLAFLFDSIWFELVYLKRGRGKSSNRITHKPICKVVCVRTTKRIIFRKKNWYI